VRFFSSYLLPPFLSADSSSLSSRFLPWQASGKKAPAKAKKEKEPVEATRRQPRRGAAENAKKVVDDDLSDEDDEEPAAESDEAFDSDEDEAPKKRGAKVRSPLFLFPPLSQADSLLCSNLAEGWQEGASQEEGQD
jgi:hypothetical protein